MNKNRGGLKGSNPSVLLGNPAKSRWKL